MKNGKSPSSFNDDTTYILYNVANYKINIENSIQDILHRFVSVIIEYMLFISEKISMKNKRHYKFIFERGIETIIHVFSVIFYYTKNLELAFYHTQKAYYFYVEFIEQISDDNVTFLQLSSRDAILFVYKKTIFELNNEYKKNMNDPSNDDKLILSTIDEYIYIYKSIVQFIINHNDFKYDTKIEYINNCCSSIKTFGETLNKNKVKKNNIECIYLFTNLISDKPIEVNEFFKLLDEFTKRLNSKRKIDDKLIKNKIYDPEINSLISNNEINEIVEWIFTEQ
jgi:hypothetical protein